MYFILNRLLLYLIFLPRISLLSVIYTCRWWIVIISKLRWIIMTLAFTIIDYLRWRMIEAGGWWAIKIVLRALIANFSNRSSKDTTFHWIRVQLLSIHLLIFNDSWSFISSSIWILELLWAHTWLIICRTVLCLEPFV